jgi:hypothetical protein
MRKPWTSQTKPETAKFAKKPQSTQRTAWTDRSFFAIFAQNFASFADKKAKKQSRQHKPAADFLDD